MVLYKNIILSLFGNPGKKLNKIDYERKIRGN